MNQSTRNRLSRSFLFMRDADKGGPAGGGETQTAPEPTGDTIENKLANARELISTWWKKATESVLEVTRLQGQFDSATQAVENEKGEHTKTKGLLATANDTISTLTRERDEAKGGLDSATKNVGRLEKLCGLHNIDPNATPAVESNEPGSKSNTPAGKWNEYQRLQSEEKKGTLPIGASTAYYREHKSDLNKYGVSQRKVAS